MAAKWPFQFLGFTLEKNKYTFHFLADAIGYPTKIKKSVMDSNGTLVLFTLAPMRFWEVLFPNGRGGIDWKRAKEWVTKKSIDASFYQAPSDGPKVYKDLTARNAPR